MAFFIIKFFLEKQFGNGKMEITFFLFCLFKNIFNPLTSPSAGAPALKYGYVNTETSSPGEAKGLIIK